MLPRSCRVRLVHCQAGVVPFSSRHLPRCGCEKEIAAIREKFGAEKITRAKDAQTLTFRYPVRRYPQKIIPCNLDKNPVIEDTLAGIKGQYLILNSGVLNVRKFAGYQVTLRGL